MAALFFYIIGFDDFVSLGGLHEPIRLTGAYQWRR